jgi:penicillin amidase
MNITRLLFKLLMGSRLPITRGTLEVSGITGPVLIRRDGYGIPYVEAQKDDDAWYGLGFCQGQDRAFQIEGLLRVVHGALSEIIGSRGVPMDRFSRRIGFRHFGELQLEAIDQETRRMFDAFARGVNDGWRLGCPRMPHEFGALGVRPTPFTASDILGIANLISFMLSALSWGAELARLKVLKEDGADALEALSDQSSRHHVPPGLPIAEAGPAIDRLAQEVGLFLSTTGMGGGSNNWAIAPSRTASGRPILANDPHLGPTLPPNWYLAHLRTPDWAVAGASFVGGPIFPIGHNGVAAWGITAGLADNTDLFLEEVGPDGKSVRQDDGFVPCEVRKEVIRFKAGRRDRGRDGREGMVAVEEDVLVTPRGPIIGRGAEGDKIAISFKATWLDPSPAEWFQSHKARSFEEFRHAFEKWRMAPLNMVYADTSGTIGWQLVGAAPRRRKGWGTVPLPGWDSENGWEESPVPFDEMPRAADPEAGLVATANNAPTNIPIIPAEAGDRYSVAHSDNSGAVAEEGPYLGMDWIEGYRRARIVEALSARKDWDVDGVLALQMDQVSLTWRDLREYVLKAPAATEEARQALTLLAQWDGVVVPDSPAASVYELFLSEMTQRVVRAKAPRSGSWALILSSIGHLARLLREQPEGWLQRPWPEEVADALGRVVHNLKETYGNEPEKWAWGRVRSLTLKHPAGDRNPIAGRIFNLGPFPWGGDTHTVNQAGNVIHRPTSNPGWIASLRMVVDVGNWEESRFVLPGGQSGNPLSPHYSDMLPLWKEGSGVPIAWSPERVVKAAKSTLRLTPEGQGG